MPCCIMHSTMAEEQGAQQACSNTFVDPSGTVISNFFFMFLFFCIIL